MALGLRRHKNRNYRYFMTRRVEVLQIEPVVPDLINGASIKSFRTNLELQHKDDWPNKQYRIDPCAHSRDVELQQNRSINPLETGFQKPDLCYPGISLCLVNREIAIPDQLAKYCVVMGSQKLNRGRVVPSSRTEIR